MATRKHPLSFPLPGDPEVAWARAAATDAFKAIQQFRAELQNPWRPSEFERSPKVLQKIANVLAPLVAAGLLDRRAVEKGINRAVGRPADSLDESQVLAAALARIGKRARGAA